MVALICGWANQRIPADKTCLKSGSRITPIHSWAIRGLVTDDWPTDLDLDPCIYLALYIVILLDCICVYVFIIISIFLLFYGLTAWNKDGLIDCYRSPWPMERCNPPATECTESVHFITTEYFTSFLRSQLTFQLTPTASRSVTNERSPRPVWNWNFEVWLSKLSYLTQRLRL